MFGLVNLFPAAPNDLDDAGEFFFLDWRDCEENLKEKRALTTAVAAMISPCFFSRSTSSSQGVRAVSCCAGCDVSKLAEAFSFYNGKSWHSKTRCK